MRTTKAKTSCIIPIYNEEKTVARVVSTALKSGLFTEVICVNDGSTDGTAAILTTFGNQIKLISFPRNRGKSYAMVAGVRRATGDIVLFCDADLVEINKSHFQGMIQPLNLGIAEQVLAIREADLELLKKLTGERAYLRKDLHPHLPKLEKTKFGAETYLNHAFKNKRTYWYLEEGLRQTGKGEGTLISKVLCADEYIKEGYDILSEIAKQKEPPQAKRVKKLIKRMGSTYNRYLALFRKFLAEEKREPHD